MRTTVKHCICYRPGRASLCGIRYWQRWSQVGLGASVPGSSRGTAAVSFPIVGPHPGEAALPLTDEPVRFEEVRRSEPPHHVAAHANAAQFGVPGPLPLLPPVPTEPSLRTLSGPAPVHSCACRLGAQWIASMAMSLGCRAWQSSALPLAQSKWHLRCKAGALSAKGSQRERMR